jgi:hypothetical protein
MTETGKENPTMTDATTNLDFNVDTDKQRVFDVIPAQTVITLQLTIRPGGAGDDGWLKKAADGAFEALDCEFTVVGGQYEKRKLWQLFTLRGTTQGHAEAGEISRNTLRAILESAKGIKPSDTGETAQNARKVSSWADFDQLRFVARLGVRPPRDGYPAKNTILEVITPDKVAWTRPEQISAKSTNSGTAPAPMATPPAGAIVRPEWGR